MLLLGFPEGEALVSQTEVAYEDQSHEHKPADGVDQKHPPNVEVGWLLNARRRRCDFEGRRGSRNDDRFVENDEGVRRKGQRLANSAVENKRKEEEEKGQRLANSAVAEILNRKKKKEGKKGSASSQQRCSRNSKSVSLCMCRMESLERELFEKRTVVSRSLPVHPYTCHRH